MARLWSGADPSTGQRLCRATRCPAAVSDTLMAGQRVSFPPSADALRTGDGPNAMIGLPRSSRAVLCAQQDAHPSEWAASQAIAGKRSAEADLQCSVWVRRRLSNF